jgi:DinB superfamily
MSSPASSHPAAHSGRSSDAPVRDRSALLAERLERGALVLAALAASLTDVEWQTPIPGDGRAVGVVVHHVASVYPVEIQFAQALGAGQPLVGVTMADVHAMNAAHAREHAGVTKDVALALLEANSRAAAAAIRALDDDELDTAAPASLYADAPVTCQFMLEDHAVRHSYHHLKKIRTALGRQG